MTWEKQPKPKGVLDNFTGVDFDSVLMASSPLLFSWCKPKIVHFIKRQESAYLLFPFSSSSYHYSFPLPPLPVSTMSSLYIFLASQTNTVKFESVYKKANLSPSALENLVIVSGVRGRLQTGYANGQKPEDYRPTAIIENLDQYLPYVLTICAQLKSYGKEPEGKLDLHWKTVVQQPDPKGFRAFSRLNSMSDECLQCFFMYAIAHYQYAEKVAQADAKSSAFDSYLADDSKVEHPSKMAIRLLRTAAGIFEWIVDTLMGMLDHVNPRRTLDTYPVVLRSLAALCEANAQELMIDVALEKGMSHSAIARLSLGIVAKLKHSINRLSSELGAQYQQLRVTLRDYMLLKAEYYNALAYYRLGLQATADRKHGEAVALHTMAKKFVDGMSSSPTDNTGITVMMNHQKVLKDNIHEAYADTKSGNDNVYFEKVPAKADLKIPEGKMSNTALPYQPPALLKTGFMDMQPVDETSAGCMIQ
jgi:BRO1-like domain